MLEYWSMGVLQQRKRIAVLVLVAALWVPHVVAQTELLITNVTHTGLDWIQLEAQAPSEERCVIQSTEDLRQPFFDIADSVRTASVGGAIAWVLDVSAVSRAFFRMRRDGKSLLTWADLEAAFAGTFAVPMAEDGDYRFGYSSGAHTQLTNGNLLVVGHPYYNRQAQVQVPSVLDGREGTLVGGWIDITGGLQPAGWPPGSEDGSLLVGGLLAIGGRVHFTKYEWYNGAGTDWQTQGFYDGEYGGGGTASGLWSVTNEYAHHSRVGGYLCLPPQAIRTNGYAYLAGLEGISGAAVGRWGPNLFAISNALSGGRLPAATLICHPTEALQAPNVRASNATSAWWVANRPTNEVWWIGNKVTDVKWIETDTRHGVLCFVYRGIGNTWYGDGAGDPYGGGSGFHAEGWALQAWIYDPDEVMEVYRGERDPWSLEPVEAVLLTERLPGSSSETHYSFFTGSAQADLKTSVRGNRLIVLQPDEYPANEWENTPKGYVFDLP